MSFVKLLQDTRVRLTFPLLVLLRCNPSTPASSNKAMSTDCVKLTKMADLAYTDDNVAKMLDAAQACASDGSLIGRDQAFIQKHFPPPLPDTPNRSRMQYYAGNWKGDGSRLAWKQVKLVFCFDDGGRVANVGAAHAHQDLACAE